MRHTGKYRRLKFIGKNKQKWCKFGIRYYDNMAKLYRTSELFNDEQQFWNKIRMVIVSTPYTTIST